MGEGKDGVPRIHSPAVLTLVLILGISALILAAGATAAVLRLSNRIGALDSPPIPGQVKADQRPIPNTGGIGIVFGILTPMIAGLIIISLHAAGAVDLTTLVPKAVADHLPGMVDSLKLGWGLVAATLGLHILGVIDDRRPLGPGIKLAAMIGAAALLAVYTDTRLLELLDARVGGSWLSVIITVIWFVAVTNAFNFIDNMDGLSAGVAAIAAACLLATSLLAGQLFVPIVLVLIVGATLGFLVFNFPPARIFMGDGGSLAIGFLLAFATVRVTYIPQPGGDAPAFAPHAVFTPLIILAIPLYDLVSVVFIRLRQGRSPLVGDLGHFSHRLVRRGLSKRDAVLVIYGCTLVTALGGVAMPTLERWQATLVFAQTLAVLCVLALLERSSPEQTP
jgi:UDP-GlcNAc:undecaprenyl-phosphate/decaprenyl-phosphate GlcNAc-1-phosphate transferase